MHFSFLFPVVLGFNSGLMLVKQSLYKLATIPAHHLNELFTFFMGLYPEVHTVDDMLNELKGSQNISYYHIIDFWPKEGKSSLSS